MKHLSFILVLLFVSVISTACINNYAIQELNNKAKVYIDNGDSESAICRLKSSLELDDQVFETHYNLGVAYLNAQKYDDAQKQLDNAIKINPDFADSYFSYAVALEEQADAIADKYKEEEKNIDDEAKEEIIKKLESAIGYYKTYLTHNKNSKDSDDVNKKISILQKEIKDHKKEVED